MKAATAALLLAISSLALATPTRAGQECSEKIVATCTKCHYQARICEKLGVKSQREWKTTIKRMLRYGLILDDPGQESILECLKNLAKDNGKLCK